MAGDLPGKDVPVYPIGSVEKLTGLTARQIRYYELKGLVAPARTPGNQRLYTQRDVERLIKVRQLMAEGYGLRNIRQLLDEEDRRSPYERADEYPGVGRMIRSGVQSLYPVKDAPRLMRLLEQRQEEKSKGAKDKQIEPDNRKGGGRRHAQVHRG